MNEPDYSMYIVGITDMLEEATKLYAFGGLCKVFGSNSLQMCVQVASSSAYLCVIGWGHNYCIDEGFFQKNKNITVRYCLSLVVYLGHT